MSSPAGLLPYAALALQLWLPLAAALHGLVDFTPAPGDKAFYAALIGAGLGFIYGVITRDAVFMAAEIFAALAFMGLRRKMNSSLREG